MTPFDILHTSSHWRSTITMALSFIVSEIKRDIGRKSLFCHTPHALNETPRQGASRRNFAIIFRMKKYNGGSARRRKKLEDNIFRPTRFDTVYE